MIGTCLVSSLLVMLICLTSFNLYAQTGKDTQSGKVIMKKTDTPVVIEGSQRFTIHSETVGDEFRIDVLLPFSYSYGNTRYPVVYLTDSTDFFPTVAGNIHLLRLTGELPEFILVGIGYPEGSPVMALRTRDLTPTLDNDFVKEARVDPYFPLPAHIDPGGAGKFLDFVEQELKPLINSRYRTASIDETLLGYSFGGLFGLYVLFNHPGAFDRYVIGSPSIWYDDGVCFRYEAEFARQNQNLTKHVFLSANELDELEDPDGIFKSIENVNRMESLLKSRDYPGLKLSSHVFAGETHQSGIGTTLNRGLRFVFDRLQ